METHTVVGVFDDHLQAQRAVDRLVEWGFTRDNVHVTSNAAATAVAAPGAAAPDASAGVPRHAETLEQRMRNVYSRAGGGKDRHDELSYYSEAVRRGSVVVTVTSGSEEGADSAADILNEHGAIDIDVHERYLRDSGWQGSPATTESAADTARFAGDEREVPVAEQDTGEGRRDKGSVRIYTHAKEPPSK